MDQKSSEASFKNLVAITRSDVVTGAYLRLVLKSLVLSTSVSMSENLGRWKPKGGPDDPLRDWQPRLSVSETLHGTAEIFGSKILAVGQDRNHSQKLELTLQSLPEFDGTSWEHSRGWIKFSEGDLDEKYWAAWSSIPYEIFQSLAMAVRRKAISKISLSADLRTHGPAHGDSESKVDVNGVEIFATGIMWDEETDFN